MSVVSPIVDEWQKKGLIQGKDWDYFYASKRRPIILAAGAEVPFTENETIFRAPLGTVLFVIVLFSHPECGVRYETTDMDTREDLQPNLVLPMSNAHPSIMWGHTSLFGGLVFLAGIPMRIYAYFVNKEWVFQRWLNLHIFNASATTQTCLGYGFFGAKVFPSGARKLGLPEELWKKG